MPEYIVFFEDCGMAKTYGDKEVGLIPGAISPAALTAIGRLVRAFAEIEDIVNLYVGKLAQTSEGITAIFLGKMPISAKVELAGYLAKLHGQSAIDVHTHLFDASFRESVACRNAVAHGVFLGKRKSDKAMAFLTSNRLDPIDSSLRREVVSYHVTDLKAYAKGAEEAVPFLADALKLTTSREKRFRQSLLPHRKSNAQAQSNKGPKSQPRSSPGKRSKKPSQAQKRAAARARRDEKLRP